MEDPKQDERIKGREQVAIDDSEKGGGNLFTPQQDKPSTVSIEITNHPSRLTDEARLARLSIVQARQLYI